MLTVVLCILCLCVCASVVLSLSLCACLSVSQELDFDDHSTGYFLLKQENGEAKLIRKQHIKDIPPESKKIFF